MCQLHRPKKTLDNQFSSGNLRTSTLRALNSCKTIGSMISPFFLTRRHDSNSFLKNYSRVSLGILNQLLSMIYYLAKSRIFHEEAPKVHFSPIGPFYE